MMLLQTLSVLLLLKVPVYGVAANSVLLLLKVPMYGVAASSVCVVTAEGPNVCGVAARSQCMMLLSVLLLLKVPVYDVAAEGPNVWCCC